MFTIRDNILPVTSTDKGTLYIVDDGGSDNESDVDPPRELSPDGVEVALFSKPEPIPTELKMVKGVQIKKNKICDSRGICLQPTCIILIYQKMMRWSFQIYYTESVTIQVCH